MKGKLVAEAAAAKPVPDIAAGTLHGLRARVSGTVVRTNLVSGTMLVVPGQAVEAGQGLIGTARAERDGTLIFQPAAGSVRAQFEWENEQDTALLLPIEQGSRPCIGRCSGTVMLSLYPPFILLRARQRPKPSSDTTSQKPSGFPFLFLSKKRHIIIKSPPIWSGPKSRLWPLQGCKVNKLYSKIGPILSF